MPDFLDCAFRRAFLTAPKCRRAARRLPRGSVFCCGKRFSTLAKTAHMGGFFAPASSAGSVSLPSCHSEARLSPPPVILRRGLPSLSVILRCGSTPLCHSEERSDEESFLPCL